MNRVLVADLAIAVAVAVLVVLLTPGLAISGVLGLIVLVLLGLTWLGGRLRRRSRVHRPATRHRRPPGRGWPGPRR